MSGKRILLQVVAGLLSVSALLAITILLVGRFGETERRILVTTQLLAGYALIALPAAILLDRGRLRRLALTLVTLAAAGMSLALASLWSGEPPAPLGKAVGTVTVFALATAQAAALAARAREGDPRSVRRLFALSCGLAVVLPAIVTVVLWAELDSSGYARVLGALLVLDLLVVALQPILARTRRATTVHRLRIVVEPGETVVTDVEAVDLAAAAAEAIRTLEAAGRSVIRLDVAKADREPLPVPRHVERRDDPSAIVARASCDDIGAGAELATGFPGRKTSRRKAGDAAASAEGRNRHTVSHRCGDAGGGRRLSQSRPEEQAMSTILLATDGSPSAEKATAAAVELARDTGWSLHVVTAWLIPPSAFGHVPIAMIPPEVGEAEEAKAGAALQRALERASAGGIEATGELRHGDAVSEICDAAEEQGASMIVVGAHGWGPVRRFISGSVSTGLLHHATCPVLVVRATGHEESGEPVGAVSSSAERS